MNEAGGAGLSSATDGGSRHILHCSKECLMRSTLVALILGVVSSLIAGLLLYKGDPRDLPLITLISLPLQHWVWSLAIIVVFVLGGLAYSYRLELCLFVIQRTENDLEQARQRLALTGSHSEAANQVLLVEITSSLTEWEREGDWITDTSHAPPDLQVTNSDRGGILRWTRSWTDYEFEFETRIDRENSAWIIRAYNLDNYVMLQCRRDRIIPHYLRDGLWWREQETNLPRALPEGWFRVCIRVQGDSVSAFWLEEGHRTVLLERNLLGPRTVSLIACRPSPDQLHYVDGPVFISYLRGGVGFRASGHESAYFRNITVRQIVDD